MTATTVPQDVASRSWDAALKITAAAALLVVLIAGSFALGRSTADESVTVVRRAPATSTPAPSSDDVPSVSLRTQSLAAPAPSSDDVPPVAGRTSVAPSATAAIQPVASDASCGHTAHTAPC
jgi:hypothetical protein